MLELLTTMGWPVRDKQSEETSKEEVSNVPS
jgi:hypothetical protein